MNKSKNIGWIRIPVVIWKAENLSIEQRMILAEIYSLSVKECFAGNAHFAKLIGKSKRTVQRHLQTLVELKYIHVIIDKNNRRTMTIRHDVHDIPRPGGASRVSRGGVRLDIPGTTSVAS